MSAVAIVDTTLRDGHQCLWATRMTTPMMLPIAESMDRAGFAAVDAMGGVHFDACVRYLHEDPWARIRALKERITATPLQGYLRSKCVLSFGLQPDDLATLWVERQLANGIDRLVGFDGLHDLDNLAGPLIHAKKLGAHTGGWLIFSQSPVHTDAFYVAKAREFLDRCRVDTIIIQDTSGILMPERVRTLVPAIRAEIGEVPLGLQSHNLAGIVQSTYIEAVAQGVDHLYTCIAPLADGNAPASIQRTAHNLRHLGHVVGVDDADIEAIGRHFEAIALHEGKPLGEVQDYDAAIFDHQIPGGVMSNFISQLEQAGLAERLDEILAECARVHADLGWPIQVTPFSQLIEVQAMLNVIDGERYARVPDEVKKYALGYYGKHPGPMDPEVMDRIVENGPRSIALEPPQPEPALPGLRRRYPDADDDELLLRHAFPNPLVDAIDRAPPDDTAYAFAANPLLYLVSQLAARPARSRIVVQKGDLHLELATGAPSGAGATGGTRP